MEHQTSKITVILIQGFLGSGKTTFIQHLSPFFANKAVGIIENEVGEVSIDAEILGEDSVELREINNGAIFCACQSHNFIQALEAFTSTDIEILIIEASGIGDPSPMKTNIDLVNRRCGDKLDYIGSICMVDSSLVLGLLEVMPVIRKQIYHANIILLNKVDLIQPTDLPRIEEKISNINQNAQIFHTTHAQIELGTIEELFVGTIAPEAEDSINTAMNRPREITLLSEKVLSREHLTEFLTHIAPHTYRIKGILQTIDSQQKKENLLVSTVNNQIELAHWPKPVNKSKLVVIFKPNPAIEEIIREAWHAYT